jgi:hypothetical protein
MAFVHGKDSHFSVDDSGGTLRNISASVDSVDGLPGDVDMAGVSAFGDSGHKYVVGLENGSFTVNGHWDDAADVGANTVLAGIRGQSGTVTFEFGPAGNGSGAVKFSGEARLTSYSISASVTDRVTFTASFNVDGQVTAGTFSA